VTPHELYQNGGFPYGSYGEIHPDPNWIMGRWDANIQTIPTVFGSSGILMILGQGSKKASDKARVKIFPEIPF